MNVNMLKEKKRVARIGRISNSCSVEESKLAPDDYVLDILKAMDQSHSKKNIVSYQQLQELKLQKKKVLRSNEIGHSSKTAPPNEGHLPIKQNKKNFQEKNFPLMAKCQKSLNYLQRNRCIPKPRAHVGFIAKPPSQPVPSLKPNISPPIPKVPSKTSQLKSCEKNKNKTLAKKSEILKKASISEKDSELNLRKEILKKDKFKENSYSENHNLEENKVCISDNDSDSQFENFLKVHQNVPNTSDKSSSDTDLKTNSKRTKHKKTIKPKRRRESTTSNVKAHFLSNESMNSSEIKAQKKTISKKRHRKIIKDKPKVLSDSESENSDLPKFEPPKKSKRKNKPQLRKYLSKVTSVPLLESDDSQDFAEKAPEVNSNKDESLGRLSVSSDSDLPMLGFGNDSSDSEDLENEKAFKGKKQTTMPCSGVISKSSNCVVQSRTDPPGFSSDSIVCEAVDPVKSLIKPRQRCNAQCIVLLKRNPLIEKKVLCLDSKSKTSSSKVPNRTCKEKNYACQNPDAVEKGCKVPVEDELKSLTSKLCLPPSDQTSENISKVSLCIDDLPSTDPEDDCMFVYENINKGSNENLKKSGCDSLPLNNYQNISLQKTGATEDAQIPQHIDHQTSFECRKPTPPPTLMKSKNVDSETDECIIICETAKTDDKTSEQPAISPTSESHPTTNLPLENCQELTVSSDDIISSKNSESEFNVQIVSVESLTKSKEKEAFNSLETDENFKPTVKSNIVPEDCSTNADKSKLIYSEGSDSDIEIIPICPTKAIEKQTEIKNAAEFKDTIDKGVTDNSSEDFAPNLLNSIKMTEYDDCLILEEKSQYIKNDIPRNPDISYDKMDITEKTNININEAQDMHTICSKKENSLHEVQQLNEENKTFSDGSKGASQILSNALDNSESLSNFVPDPKILELLSKIDFECIKKVINGTSLENHKSISEVNRRPQIPSTFEQRPLNLQSNLIVEHKTNSLSNVLKEGNQIGTQREITSNCKDINTTRLELPESVPLTIQKNITVNEIELEKSVLPLPEEKVLITNDCVQGASIDKHKINSSVFIESNQTEPHKEMTSSCKDTNITRHKLPQSVLPTIQKDTKIKLEKTVPPSPEIEVLMNNDCLESVNCKEVLEAKGFELSNTKIERDSSIIKIKSKSVIICENVSQEVGKRVIKSEKANQLQDSNVEMCQSLKEKVEKMDVPSTTKNVPPVTANPSFALPNKLPASNMPCLVTKSDKHIMSVSKKTSSEEEKKTYSLIKKEKDLEMKNNIESLSDEMDLAATSLISNLEKQKNETIMPLLDLYKAEYKKYREILCTEKNVSAGLKLLQENQAKKLSHICCSIRKLVKHDPCLYKVANQLNDKTIHKDKKNLVKEEGSKVTPASTTAILNKPIKIETNFNSTTMQSTSKAQAYSHTKNPICARCDKPATGLCLGCKQVYYCSTNCGEISWIQGHNQTCRGGN